MTDPKQAISEQHHGIHGAGRLYGVEGFDKNDLRCEADSRAALREGLIFPSVTNVIGLYPKDHLQGWYGREAAKSLGAASAVVARKRASLASLAVANGSGGAYIASLMDPDLPPVTASRRIQDGTLDIEALRREGSNWVDAASFALTDACSMSAMEAALFAGTLNPVKKGWGTFFSRMKKGELSKTEHDTLVAKRQQDVIEVLRCHPDASWLFTRLADTTSGVALIGEAAARSRDESAVYGTAVHDLVENLTNDDDYYHDGTYQYHVDAWRSWRDQAGLTEVCPELTVRGVTTDGLRYGGTADLFAKMDGRGAVIDYKTSRSLSEKTVAFQMAALAKADTVPFDIEFGIGLHLPRQVDAEKLLKYRPKDDDSYLEYEDGYRAYLVEGEDMEHAYETFCSARRLWQDIYG